MYIIHMCHEGISHDGEPKRSCRFFLEDGPQHAPELSVSRINAILPDPRLSKYQPSCLLHCVFNIDFHSTTKAQTSSQSWARRWLHISLSAEVTISRSVSGRIEATMDLLLVLTISMRTKLIVLHCRRAVPHRRLPSLIECRSAMAS